MKAQDIQSALSEIPQGLKDVHPGQIKEYFETNYPELSEQKIKLLVANYAYNNLTRIEKDKAWDNVKLAIVQKYANLSYDLTELLPWLRIVHAQGDSGLVVTEVQ